MSPRKYLAALLLIVTVLAVSLTVVALPVLANPGLTVSSAILVADVSPGEKLTHEMTVSIGKTDAATDIVVEILGMAQSPDGVFWALGASQDTSPYSARSLITVDKSSFHLEPGASQNVTATIQIPSDIGAGGRYSIIKIATQAKPGGAGISFIMAANVPVYLTVRGSQLMHTGKIMAVSTEEPVSGQPIEISTTFQNTGNHNFKVKGDVTVSSARGETVGTIPLTLTRSSVVPTMSLQLKASFIPKKRLPVGVYAVKSTVMLDDGTVLDEAQGSFQLKQAYVPPSAGVNWPLIGGGVAGVVIIALLALLLRRRGIRRRKTVS